MWEPISSTARVAIPPPFDRHATLVRHHQPSPTINLAVTTIIQHHCHHYQRLSDHGDGECAKVGSSQLGVVELMDGSSVGPDKFLR
ncbi:hypothetical protein M8C21_022524 [Ambrosia artemisiifolia]|uniref:Uncharacterized protein n=1 Tax=Ambrosia artemisiifolia TaxID=4212 RepID=A0AAD5GNT9_AMBAR|nr:hypothetical protein M8C21_022524 [Ambrosia artemisiifolia]